MKLVLAHAKVLWLALIRVPAYWVPTLIFPAMLFSLFGLAPARTSPEAAAVLMASFSAFAVIGVSFYQFGVGIAQDRINPWDSYIRTLPSGGWPRILGQLIVALVFSAGAAGMVVILTLWGADLALSPERWLRYGAGLLGGAVPFVMMGIAIGYLAPAKAAVPIANLLHLPLTFAGGLWMRPDDLPGFVQTISPYVPTRHMGEVVWAGVLGLETPMTSWYWLVGYTVVFGFIAIWARRRDDGERFG